MDRWDRAEENTPKVCRPGGVKLTEKLLEFVKKYGTPDLQEELRVLDIGCGEGGTLAWLGSRFPHWERVGLDPEPASGSASFIRRGRAEQLAFPDASFDLVLMECSFSRTEDPGRALEEILRVLAPGGKLLLSDLYRRDSRPWHRLVPDRKSVV